MTLWTFGDSFTKHFDYIPDTWVERTRRLMNIELKSYSKPMTTLEYTFYKFNEERNNIKPNDVVIIGITTLRRRWFWPEKPFRGLELNKTEQKASDNYEKYLSHYDEIQKIYLTNFLFNAHYLTKKLNLHTIIIPNFYDFDVTLDTIRNDLPLFHIAKGRIGIVSDYEFKEEIVSMATVEWFMKSDKRMNHFIRSNHIRISDKIMDNIYNKTPLDFTQGMVQGIVDNELLDDPKFREEELFSDAWKRWRD